MTYRSAWYHFASFSLFFCATDGLLQLPGSAEESKNGVHNGRMSEDEEWRNSLRRSSVSNNGNGNALRASSYNLPSIDNRTRFVYLISFGPPFTLFTFDGI